MAVLRELFFAEPILTTVVGIVALILVVMIRDIVVGLHKKQDTAPYSWE